MDKSRQFRVTRHYTIEGKVQGVGFRWWTQRTAVKLGVTGWVFNLEDGTVGCIASGTTEQLARFEERLNHGPAGSRVEAVNVQTNPTDAVDWPRDDFLIRR